MMLACVARCPAIDNHAAEPRPMAGASRPACGSAVDRRQPDREGRAVPKLGGDHQLAAVTIEDVLDDGQAQTGAALLPARRHVDAIEALGQPRQMLGGDAWTVVDDLDPQAAGPAVLTWLAADPDLDPAAA